MAGKRSNGEGSISKRRDGRYEAAGYVLTMLGTRKRIRKYAYTREDAHRKLTDALAKSQGGIPIPDRQAKLGDYLDYWFENFGGPNLAPSTYVEWRRQTEKYIKKRLGARPIADLSVPLVQAYINQIHADTNSPRTAQIIRTILSTVLARAEREELVTRNVAALTEKPKYVPREVHPWTVQETDQFLIAAQSHPLNPAFQLLALCGLRQGEVLGLRWRDINFERGEIYVRQKVQTISSKPQIGPLKTKASKRDLSLPKMARESLQDHKKYQHLRREAAGAKWRGSMDEEELVFTTANGGPIAARNFCRTYEMILAQNGVRKITMHHIRHSFCTRLKEAGVPIKDAQLLMGHASVLTTLEIYQHGDMDSRRSALDKVEGLFGKSKEDEA